MKQTCFVVMGYGKKMDYATGKTVDLDKVYKTIIQPVVASSGYRCVRGDEVKDPSLIDRSMYNPQNETLPFHKTKCSETQNEASSL